MQYQVVCIVLNPFSLEIEEIPIPGSFYDTNQEADAAASEWAREGALIKDGMWFSVVCSYHRPVETGDGEE